MPRKPCEVHLFHAPLPPRFSSASPKSEGRFSHTPGSMSFSLCGNSPEVVLGEVHFFHASGSPRPGPRSRHAVSSVRDSHQPPSRTPARRRRRALATSSGSCACGCRPCRRTAAAATSKISCPGNCARPCPTSWTGSDGLARIASQHPAQDGSSRLLVQLADGQSCESVLLARDGLCVSTQIGCAVGCRFCMTGRDGLLRQIGSAEIVAQVALARTLRPVKKVVFMGMGEPAHNLVNVMDAIEFLGTAGNIGHKNLVFSTVGDERVFERLPPRARSSLHSPCRCTARATTCGPSCCRARRVSHRPIWSRRATATRAKRAIRCRCSGRCWMASTTRPKRSRDWCACSRAGTPFST